MLALLILSGLILALKIKQLRAGNRKAAAERAACQYEKLTGIGTVASLTVMPLVDFYTADDRLKTEAGVAYLIKAGDTTLLMDVGFNQKKEHPSPLLHNLQTLGFSFAELNFLFFSHLHLDHVGGLREHKRSRFSISQGPVALPPIPAYSPAPVEPSSWNPGPKVKVITKPEVLAPGVASIGVIPRNLFLQGYTLENSLAIHIENRGIVLVVGCGHQKIERLLERTRELFDAPLYGVIGGLHFPVKNGRLMLGPFNLQNIAGTDTPPWKSIGKKDVAAAIAALKAADPALVALSPHDSSDWSLAQFKKAFGKRYQTVKVGRELRLS